MPLFAAQHRAIFARSKYTLASTFAMLFAIALFAYPFGANAGPPFQTDDPEPVDLGHYEFYVFSSRDATPIEADTTGPGFEFNWGVLPNTQFHIVTGFGAAQPSNNPIHAPAGQGPSAYGVIDTEIGIKYRFVEQTKYVPEIGTFPMIEVPTGSYARGLGVGKTWYKFPIWVQKDFGPWTTYGGAGYQVVNQTDFKNFAYQGWLLQRDIGEKWTLGGEIWHHGPEGLATAQTESATMIDLGGYHYFRKPGFQLLFCLGHSVAGQSETYAYLGLYWTWGGKPGEGEKPQEGGGKPQGAAAFVPTAWSQAGRLPLMAGGP